MTGKVIPLREVPDETFSEGRAGEGAAITPSEGGDVIAPVSGRLAKLFEGGHAFEELPKGAELIVHLGLDTIELNGKGFDRIAVEGDMVEAGQTIVRVDLQAVRSTGYNPVTPVVVANADAFQVTGGRGDQDIQCIAAGEVMFKVVAPGEG